MTTTLYTNAAAGRDFAADGDFTVDAPAPDDTIQFNLAEGADLLPDTNLPVANTYQLEVLGGYDVALADFWGSGATVGTVLVNHADAEIQQSINSGTVTITRAWYSHLPPSRRAMS